MLYTSTNGSKHCRNNALRRFLIRNNLVHTQRWMLNLLFRDTVLLVYHQCDIVETEIHYSIAILF